MVFDETIVLLRLECGLTGRDAPIIVRVDRMITRIPLNKKYITKAVIQSLVQNATSHQASVINMAIMTDRMKSPSFVRRVEGERLQISQCKRYHTRSYEDG